MSSADKDVQVARIAAWQAVLVAVVTAAGGLTAGYLSRPAPAAAIAMDVPQSSETAVLQAKLDALESQNDVLSGELEVAKASAAAAASELKHVRVRVRDLLGPKGDSLKSISNRLAEIESKIDVSDTFRRGISDEITQLTNLDNQLREIADQE